MAWTYKKQKILRRGGKNTQKNCTKFFFHNPDNHDVMITHLEPDILECEDKWALGSITTNKASEGDGIPVELLQILKDDAVKVLHSICQHIWKTQQWPQDWKRSVFIPIPKKGLQSPFAVILEPQKIKSDTVSTVSPSVCHEVMGLDAMILVF